MPSNADEYRSKAAEFAARATTEQNSSMRSELESLALAYMRLADQAERNSQADLVYETPPLRSRRKKNSGWVLTFPQGPLGTTPSSTYRVQVLPLRRTLCARFRSSTPRNTGALAPSKRG
jgi:hypothetical protein